MGFFSRRPADPFIPLPPHAWTDYVLRADSYQPMQPVSHRLESTQRTQDEARAVAATKPSLYEPLLMRGKGGEGYYDVNSPIDRTKRSLFSPFMSSLTVGVPDILSTFIWRVLDENEDPDRSRVSTQQRWLEEGLQDLFFRALFECFTHGYCVFVDFPSQTHPDRTTTWDLLANEEIMKVVPDGFGRPERIKTAIRKADAGRRGTEGVETDEQEFWEFDSFHIFTPWQTNRSHAGWTPLFSSWGPDIYLDNSLISMCEFDMNEGNGIGMLVTGPLAPGDKSAIDSTMSYRHWIRLLHIEVPGDASKVTYARSPPSQVDYPSHRKEMRQAMASAWRVTENFVGMDPTSALSASTMDAEANRARMKAIFARFAPLIRWMIVEILGEEPIEGQIMADFNLRESQKEQEEMEGLFVDRVVRSPLSYAEMREKLEYPPLPRDLKMYEDYHPMLGNMPVTVQSALGQKPGIGQTSPEDIELTQPKISEAEVQVARADSLHEVQIASPGEVVYGGRPELRPAHVLKRAVERKARGIPLGIGTGLHGPEVADKDEIGWATPRWDSATNTAVADLDIDPERLADIEARRPDLADLIEQIRNGEFAVSPAFLARVRAGIETDLDLRSIIVTPSPRDRQNRTLN